MLSLFNTVKVTGNLAPPLTLDDVLDRKRLTSIAQQIYDTDPNLVARVRTDEGAIVIKLFGWRHPIHRTLSPTFPSRAQASWDTAQALLNAGARTPQPIFVYTKRKWRIIRDNILITQAIHPHQTLRALLSASSQREMNETAVRDLARSIARMHNAGIFHRDLTTGNFLVNDRGEVYIIDLNRAQCLPKLSTHQRLTDLSKLYFKAGNNTLEAELVTLFFGIYSNESSTKRDWISGYRDYRKGLLQRRHYKQQLRRLLGRK